VVFELSPLIWYHESWLLRGESVIKTLLEPGQTYEEIPYIVVQETAFKMAEGS
jgi:hypothetical protein